jgi:hypothetical protein
MCTDTDRELKMVIGNHGTISRWRRLGIPAAVVTAQIESFAGMPLGTFVGSNRFAWDMHCQTIVASGVAINIRGFKSIGDETLCQQLILGNNRQLLGAECTNLRIQRGCRFHQYI